MDLTELKGVTISKKRALKIIEQHGCTGDIEDFYKECKNKNTYSALAVFYWLGY
jgi:hypothetical protein